MSGSTGIFAFRARGASGRLLLALALAAGAAAGCGGNGAPPGPGGDAKPAPGPAAQPAPATAAKDADLSFRFPEGFSFGLRVKAEQVRTQGGQGGRQVFDLTMKGRVSDVEDGRPARLELFDVSGPQEYGPVGGDGTGEAEKTDNRGGGIAGGVDEAWRLTGAKDSGQLSDDILLVYPAGPVFGFVPPKGRVEPGARWPSGELVPAGPKTLSKRQIVFSEAKGEFELKEIAGDKARIAWTGTAKADLKGRVAKSAAWTSSIVFDAKSGRTQSVETEFKIEFEEGVAILYKTAAAFTHP